LDNLFDLVERCAGLVCQLGTFFHLTGTLFHSGYRFARFNLDTFDKACNVLRCSGGTLCEFPHFVSHHGKAPALLASAGSLDCSIQREEVRLGAISLITSMMAPISRERSPRPLIFFPVD
jgi:hypothetical protein